MRNGAQTGSPEMMVVMRASASAEEVAHIVGLIEEAGGGAHVTEDGDATVIGAIGERAQIAVLPLEGLPGVDQVLPLRKPYKWVSREFSKTDTVIDVLGHKIGDGAFMVMAGPCSVESSTRCCRPRAPCQPAGASDAARRRVQAAHLAVRVPGSRRSGSSCSRRRAGDGAAASSPR